MPRTRIVDSGQVVVYNSTGNNRTELVISVESDEMEETHSVNADDAFRGCGRYMAVQPTTPDEVLCLLIDYIRENNLRAGDRLPSIREFGEQWNVGRNVTRDGFQRAESMGLIRVHPGAGAFVAEFNYSQLANIISRLVEFVMHQSQPLLLNVQDVRCLIEVDTVRRVAENRTDENLFALWEQLVAMQQALDRETFVKADESFHLVIARASSNPLLSSILETLFTMLRSHRLRLTWSDEEREKLYQVHRSVYDAIVNKDPDTAVELALQHLVHQRQQLLGPMRQTQDNNR